MKANLHIRWDWTAAAILIAALFTASVRLDTTDWTPDLGYVESLAVLGTILGLALGLSKFKRSSQVWLAVLYTIVIIPTHLRGIITGEETALGQLSSLGGRLAVTIDLLLNGKPINDHIFFVSLMSLLFWGIGIYSGYQLVRNREIFKVLLPSTIPILIIQYYDSFIADRIWGLALYFFLALMLAGRINLLNSRERWVEQNVVAGNDPEFDLNKNIAVAAAVIIMAAWMLPAPAAIYPTAARIWQNINQPLDNFRTRMNDILAALNSSRPNYAEGQLYGDVMGLGRVAGSGITELFNVRVPQNDLPRLYWRMRVYDTYQNASWQTRNSQNTDFEPGTGNIVADGDLQGPVAQFTFNWRSAQSAMLVTPSLPVWASRSGSIQTALDPQAQMDPLSWSVLPNIQKGDQYQVRAELFNPTQKELRHSSPIYPDWIIARYLQVPATILTEYRSLALQITSGSATNFDKAEAVTEYLRKNITYSDSVPLSPPGTDPLSWFLFDWKSGFCDYYASAEVMLLRSVGIPARMVVGFAEGTLTNNGIYSIKGEDVHAWPEVYFPGSGWVQFEPTVNQAVLVRPTGDVQAGGALIPNGGYDEGFRTHPGADQEFDQFLGKAEAPVPTFLGLTRARWQGVIISAIIIAVLGVIGWRMQRRQSFTQRAPRALKAIFSHYNLKSPSWVDRWLRWSEVSSAERSFHAVNQALQWLERPQPGHVTPAERASLLKELLPDAAEEVDILYTSLEKTLYSPLPTEAASAIRASWRLRYLTVRKIVQSWM